MVQSGSDDYAWAFPFDPTAGNRERQIYRGLRDAILARRLAPGARLPATRRMAERLGVSRGTVVAAYEQLAAEGYLDARTGRGTIVAAMSDVALKSLPTTEGPAPSARAETFGRAAANNPPWPRCFRPGLPSLADFPQKEWSRCLAARARTLRRDDLSYHHADGLPLLQEALAGHLNRARGVVADPGQIVIVPSAQAAFDAIVLCCTDPGDTVAVEDPGYPGARHVFAAAAANVAPVPVDNEGLVAAALEGVERLRLIAVTPSHHYPTGVTMTLRRRLALLEAARRRGAVVLEDDYDSEFRYAERPIASLQGIDGGRHVVYVGTFSKLLAPGIRIAFIVAPPRLAARMADITAALGQVVSHHVQAAVADFINEGYLAAHVGRTRPLYAAKRDALVAALRTHLPEGATVAAPRGGLQLLVRLPDHVDDLRLVEDLADADLAAVPLSPICVETPRPGLLLGFALPHLEEIAPAAQRLAAIVARRM